MCVFCEIVKGNIPGVKIYEDDLVLAILDLSQVTKGHALVMPKEHYDTLLECPKETLDRMIETAQRIAKLQMTKFHAKGFNILNNGYEAAGQSVMHAHIHVIPRYDENDAIEVHFNPSAPQDLKEVAKLYLE